MTKPRATCPKSNVTLDTKVLKTITRLSTKLRFKARIPIIKEGEDKIFGAYTHPHLKSHVLVGPFTTNKKGQSNPRRKQKNNPPPPQKRNNPPNWLGTRGKFIKEPIVYKDWTGKYVYITPQEQTRIGKEVDEANIPMVVWNYAWFRNNKYRKAE